MSAAQDGRARAIEAAVSSICGRFGGGTPLLDSNLPVGDLARTAIDAALADGGVVTREHAVYEREWGNAHFADWQRERDRADAWMRACADLPCQHDPDNPCDDDWAFHQSTGEEVCNSCWARVSLKTAQERTS